MIRINPFNKLSYNELQRKYLLRLLDEGAIAFNKEDLFNEWDISLFDDDDNKIYNNKYPEETQNTYELLNNNGWKCKRLLKFLFTEDGKVIKDNLRLLLVGPDELPSVLGENGSFESFRQYFEMIIKKIGSVDDPRDKDVVKKIFKYVSFKKKKVAYWLQLQLGVEVCPYCNRMYTTTLSGEKKARPDFDHFYPKGEFPYLAVSLFNLIPSCSVCNKRKGSNKLSIIYPYDESFNETQRQISFRVIPNKIYKMREVMMGQSDDFVIELQPQNYSDILEFDNPGGVLVATDIKLRFKHKFKDFLGKKQRKLYKEEYLFWCRAEASIELFLIEDLYNEHKKEIMSLLKNHYQYNQDSIELIMQSLLRGKYPNATEGEIKLYTKDILYFAFLQPDEWGKSPLNKLKSNIIEQLDEM